MLDAIEGKEVVDVTELKHYLHRVNVHRTNPPFFKKINDIALKSGFAEQWTHEQLKTFIIENAFLQAPADNSDASAAMMTP